MNSNRHHIVIKRYEKTPEKPFRDLHRVKWSQSLNFQSLPFIELENRVKAELCLNVIIVTDKKKNTLARRNSQRAAWTLQVANESCNKQAKSLNNLLLEQRSNLSSCLIYFSFHFRTQGSFSGKGGLHKDHFEHIVQLLYIFWILTFTLSLHKRSQKRFLELQDMASLLFVFRTCHRRQLLELKGCGSCKMFRKTLLYTLAELNDTAEPNVSKVILEALMRAHTSRPFLDPKRLVGGATCATTTGAALFSWVNRHPQVPGAEARVYYSR
ncbi:hypothetical protein CEXT_29221 [Caerostris extrusa]|uniref:Uncharacterized protein n=1 Tax=Caerostris extrusa TaxID=172846 RepID=A0AAV4QA34_CAEEX|nr:hypothetical protein CEXT_29221 [Caerostris extrusa]